MIYTGTRLTNIPFPKNALVLRSDNYLVAPFYLNRFSVPFDWGYKRNSIACNHLALSVLADFYNITEKEFPEFPFEMKDIIRKFKEDFVRSFDTDWELESDEIANWLEQFTDDVEEPKEDNREINFIIYDIIEPNY